MVKKECKHVLWSIFKFFYSNHHWRAKSLDDQERSYSSSNLYPTLAKQSHPHPIHYQRANLKDLQKPLTIHIDCQLPSSSSSKVLLRSSSSTNTTTTTMGCRDMNSSLHVPCSNTMKAQRRLSKRYVMIKNLIHYDLKMISI